MEKIILELGLCFVVWEKLQLLWQKLSLVSNRVYLPFPLGNMVGSGVESSKMAASWERKEKWGESQVVQFSQNVPRINRSIASVGH